MRIRGRGRGTVLLTVLCIVAVSCSSDPADSSSAAVVGLDPDVQLSDDPTQLVDAVAVTADNSEEITRVVMIGDSITVASRPALEAEFAALGLESVIEAQNGKRVAVPQPENPGGTTVAANLRNSTGPTESEVWVIALGTNDIGPYNSPDEIAGAVNELLATVPEDVGLIWVDTYYRDRPEQTDAVNLVIYERVGGRGNAVVAPWTSFAEDDGVMGWDGVHPTPAGEETFAAVVANTVAGFIGR